MQQTKIATSHFDMLFDGAIKCMKNAQELCDEAELLHQHGKFARAFALSHFAHEEFANSVLLFRALLDVSTQKKVNWKKLKRHTLSPKQKCATKVAITKALLVDLHLDADAATKQLILEIELKKIRQNHALYTQCINTEFVLPSERISETQSEKYMNLAIYRIAKLGPALVELRNLQGMTKQEVKLRFSKKALKNMQVFLAVVLESNG
ncbi:hypothetical protein VHA01S_049_00240 [Vibrio halioticoli NBRC 102217]|uniref:AbiV family abortive infection protein n=1 Tax=Vibrio halioticoli NBRC 102217 TaxID=1219072 RepID=V5F559_9VIBR|nr:AbiV family abortive infection protein [Vibrio halioticoli]GAD90629.1 hypothetical protein VHA01S_049_00240 [Vibrio halioticoli NBRC 102217]